MDRTEYPAMLASLQPSQAITVLNDRLKHVSKTNIDIADWLQERRRIEEAYVQGLRKLAKKTPPDETSELGVFTSPWQKVTSATESLAESHHAFARRIETDIEKPLREYSTHNREMQQISNMQGNLNSMAKDLDVAQKKAGKLRDKGGRSNASKVAGATEDSDVAQASWDSQAPYVFETLQAVDESRFNYLRDVLTQYQTHEVDKVEKNRSSAEKCLNALLSIETADEIKTFALRNSGSAARAPSRNERPATSDRTGRRNSRAMAPETNRLAPTVSSDSASRDVERSPSNANGTDILRRSDQSPGPESVSETPKEKKSRFGGLKRFGTVVSRRRQSMLPSSSSRPSPSGRQKSSTRLGSSTDLVEEDVPEGPFADTRSKQPPRSSSYLPPIPQDNDGQAPDHGQLETPSSGPRMNGYNMDSSSAGISNGPVSNHDALARLQRPLTPNDQTVSTTQASQAGDESFSTPSRALDPISAAQAEAADQPGELNQPIKVDIRNAPIAEEGPAADAAMANVANALRAQAVPSRRGGTLRGRRDVRNTVFIPSGEAPSFAETQPSPATQPMVSPPIPTTTTGSPLPPLSTGVASAPVLHRNLPSEDHGSDSQSIRSNRSLASTSTAGGGMIKHPDLTESGLHSSIVETVNATIENGSIARVTVLGELALAYNPATSFSTPAGRESIRLDNFQILEKVAPNPSFVAQLAADRPGEYAIDLAAMGATHGRPSVAFKYQVHTDATAPAALARHAPLILTPSWRVEATQVSVILSYSLNPAFAAAASGPVMLHNVVLVVHLDGARASSCQNKPSGTFSREKSLVYWRFDSVTLAPGTPQKAIARFVTEGQGRPGKVEARWEVHDVHGGSGLGVSRMEERSDPFADAVGGGSWTVVGGARRLVSGSYVASGA